MIWETSRWFEDGKVKYVGLLANPDVGSEQFVMKWGGGIGIYIRGALCSCEVGECSLMFLFCLVYVHRSARRFPTHPEHYLRHYRRAHPIENIPRRPRAQAYTL